MKRKLKVNDFFCGCGGMGIAFKNAGYEIAGAWDFDKYAVESYRANVGDHVQKADIKAIVTPLTGSAVNTAADNLKGNNSGFHQEINITSPKALSPYEVARQTRIQTRAMIIAMQRG